jgi:hypothetical protein
MITPLLQQYKICKLTVVVIKSVIHQQPSHHLPMLACLHAVVQLVQNGISSRIPLPGHLASHEMGVQLCLGDEEVQLSLLPASLQVQNRED